MLSLFRKEGLSLLDALVRSQDFKATRPEDRIYALLGMCREVATTLIPNYEDSVEKIYEQYAQFFVSISPHQATNMLGHAGIHRRSSKRMSLPLWVPDWSWNPSMMNFANNPNFNFSASGPIPPPDTPVPRVQVKNGVSELVVRGATIDTYHRSEPIFVDSTTTSNRIPDSLDQVYWKTFLDWDTAVWAILNEQKPHQTPAELEELFEVVGRVLVLGSWTSPVGPLYRKLHDQLRATNPPSGWTSEVDRNEKLPGHEPNYWRFISNMRFMPVNRRFAITSMGYIGLVPAPASAGDTFCIILGSRAPFILRRVGEDDICTYQVMGDAYVLNMMNGEAFDTEGFSFEDVHLR